MARKMMTLYQLKPLCGCDMDGLYWTAASIEAGRLRSWALIFLKKQDICNKRNHYSNKHSSLVVCCRPILLLLCFHTDLTIYSCIFSVLSVLWKYISELMYIYRYIYIYIINTIYYRILYAIYVFFAI
jgi:hypothetical protein